MKISETAVKLILRFEGLDQPGSWPGGASGVSCGIGYDLGYEPNFKSDWKGLLPDEAMKRLAATVGLKGQSAATAAKKLRDIKIPMSAAKKVFEAKTIPVEEQKTSAVFLGSDMLPPDAFGGLVSLVFNRGPLVNETDKRREMLALHRMFLKSLPSLDDIAEQVDSMKRLWPKKGTGYDLYARRVAEAKLIREAV